MEATLAERGQVVIPKAIRDQLGLTPGTLLTFSVEGGKLVIRKKLDDAFARARGILKLPPGETVDSIMRELRGRAPTDPIEPWEILRDDMPVPAHIRDDHAKRRAQWLETQSANLPKRETVVKPRAPKVASAKSAGRSKTAAKRA